MATLRYGPAGTVKTVTAATFLVLGDAADDTISSWVVELRPTAATYSVTFKGRVRGVADPVTGDAALAYTDLTANTTTAGGTALTGTTASTILLLRVTADGCVAAIDIGTLSAGSIDVVAWPVRG